MRGTMLHVLLATVAYAATVEAQATLDIGLLLPDPNNRYSYYAFVPQLRQCPSGLVFNPKQHMCDLPANVECNCNGTSGGGGGGGGDKEGNYPIGGKGPAVDPLDVPHFTDCGLFCRCDNGEPKLDKCPAGLHFNSKRKICDWPEAAGCVIGGTMLHVLLATVAYAATVDAQARLNIGLLLPDPNNRSSYYALVPQLRQCPSGLVFNPKQHMCDWPANVECNCNGTSGGGGGGGDKEGNYPIGGKGPAVDPLDVPHFTDCGLFCRCDNGEPKLDKCPAGLHFNSKKKICDWPEAAGCVIGVCKQLSNNGRGYWQPSSCVNKPSEVGDKCKLVCNADYELSGSAEITCTAAGWSGATGIDQIPSCKTVDETVHDFVKRINDTMGPKANLLFVIDESGSVKEHNFEIELNFVKAIVRAFPLSVNRSAGLITFDNNAAVDISIREADTCKFLKSMDKIKYNGGDTDIHRSLNLAYDEITKNAVHTLTLVFLVTDGVSQTNPQQAAKLIRDHGDALFTVGVANYDVKQLAPLSSLDKKGSPLFYGIKNFAVFHAIAEYLATQYNNGTALPC